MTSTMAIQDFGLWKRFAQQRKPVGFDIELTARCNFDCRHCYINRPSDDAVARATELTREEILDIARQAAALGAVWCTLTGGEPLLRPDFAEIYLGLKRLGLLVSVLTNAALVGTEHVTLFQKYPPRDIEVTMYGASAETYERVTRRPASFVAFNAGLERLLSANIKVRLKAMALRSNRHELEAIARFCRARTKDYYRFDPVLHLRMDRNPLRNAEILAERLSPAEVVALESADPERVGALRKHCDHFIQPVRETLSYDRCRTCEEREGCERYAQFSRLLSCGAGTTGFSVSWDGQLRLCQSLNAPGTTYDLRRGSLREAWEEFIPQVRALRTQAEPLLRACKSCPIVNLCLNCPAHAWLELGDREGIVPYFCQVARARKESLLSCPTT